MLPAMSTLQGKTLFVTGASRGIGKAIGLAAAREGANVVIAAKSSVPNPKLPGTIHTAADEIERAGGKALALKCDVRDDAQISAAVQTAVERFGKLTILVNNAGGGGPKPFDMPLSDFRRAFELNVFSLFRLCQLAAPEMEVAGTE